MEGIAVRLYDRFGIYVRCEVLTESVPYIKVPVANRPNVVPEPVAYAGNDIKTFVRMRLDHQVYLESLHPWFTQRDN